MKKKRSFSIFTVIILLMTGLLSACSSSNKTNSSATANTSGSKSNTVTLTIGGYSTIKDQFEAIFPLFQKEWKQKTGQTVVFKESYQGSGAQAQNIINGFEADIAVLSLDGDINKIQKAGLITHNWKSNPYKGEITKSIAVFGVRDGNPKGIKDWTDLTKPGVQVLLPDPATSGGAKWDVNAIYGAGLKIAQEKTGKQDPAQAKQLLSQIYKNVKTLGKSGEESMSTFDNGVGDVIITYGNVLLARIQAGKKYEEVIPKNTTLIENPAAIVDKYVDQHGTRKVAEAFLNFLWSPEAQKVLAENGFRPVNPTVEKEFANKYKTPAGLFDINYLGGWNKVNQDIYGNGGIWDQVVAGN